MTSALLARRPELLALKKVACTSPDTVVTRADLIQVAEMLCIPGIVPKLSNEPCPVTYRDVYTKLINTPTVEVKAIMLEHGVDNASVESSEWTADKVVLQGNFPRQEELARKVIAVAFKARP